MSTTGQVTGKRVGEGAPGLPDSDGRAAKFAKTEASRHILPPGRIFDPDTGALARDFVPYTPSGNAAPRGYGRTKALDSHPFLKPEISVVVAPTGGGKTTLLLNILDEIVKHVNPKKVNRIMFYTGSPQDDLLARLNPEVVDIYGPDQTESFLGELRTLQLEYMTAGVGGSDVAAGEVDKPFNVLILDDAGNSRLLTPSQTKGTDIGEIFMRHRHLRMHVIVSAQRWMLLPVFLRSNLTHLFLFPGGSKSENGKIFQTFDLPEEQLERIMSTIQGRPHEFLWVDRERRTAKREFNQVLLQ